MNRTGAWLIAALFLALLIGCQGAPAPAPGNEPQSPLARGEYLVSVLGCDDCHTPKKMGPQGPEPDMSRRFIGHPEDANLPAPPTLPPGPWIAVTNADLTAWSGPWGISYAINLTPDEDTGIKVWTEDMWIKAMRTGKHMGESRPILPPMPWQDFSHLTDEDLKAVYAYLMSRPPVKNRVPDPVIAPPPPGASAAPSGDASAAATGATGKPSGL